MTEIYSKPYITAKDIYEAKEIGCEKNLDMLLQAAKAQRFTMEEIVQIHESGSKACITLKKDDGTKAVITAEYIKEGEFLYKIHSPVNWKN